MRSFEIEPGGRLSGRIRVPGDKSISHRVVMLGAIADGTTRARGFLGGADARSTIDVFRALGVTVEGPDDDGGIVVHGAGLHGLRAPGGPLDCGNAGTAMRLLMGLLAGQGFASTLIGDESLSRRPMRRVAEPLRQMGADIETGSAGAGGPDDGRPPVRIRPVTRLRAIRYAMPVASAQLKSALLLAGLYADGETIVIEPAPTRDHTERMLGGFGADVVRDGASVALRGGQSLRAASFDIPADLSSAAFFLVGASIAPGSDLVLEHVGLNPTRTGCLDILRRMGADIEVLAERDCGGEPAGDLRVRSAPLRGIEIPPELVPLAIDEFPALFVAACCAEGRTVLRGAHELRVKESDRIATMAEGLARLGVETTPCEDGIVIEGRGGDLGVFRGGRVQTHHDHRIAMALSMAALRATGAIGIDGTGIVDTSFPDFVALAHGAGMAIRAHSGQ